MSLPPMESRNQWSRIDRRLTALASEIAALRSASGTLDAATIVDRDTGARMTLTSAQLTMWPNFVAAPDVFSLFQTDSTASRMSRWFGPAAAAFRAANSISIQGAAAGTPGNVWIYTNGAFQSTSIGASYVTAGGNIVLDAGSRVYVDGETSIDLVTPLLRLYGLPTTGAAANLRYDPGTASVQYVTSSRRYKEDIQDLDIDVDAFLRLRPVSWLDKGEVQRSPDTACRNVGFIAEEVDELGLPYVEYDDEARPDALQYDRIVTGAVKALQQQADTIASQQEQLDSQAAQIDALSARLDALEAPAKLDPSAG